MLLLLVLNIFKYHTQDFFFNWTQLLFIKNSQYKVFYSSYCGTLEALNKKSSFFQPQPCQLLPVVTSPSTVSSFSTTDSLISSMPSTTANLTTLSQPATPQNNFSQVWSQEKFYYVHFLYKLLFCLEVK